MQRCFIVESAGPKRLDLLKHCTNQMNFAYFYIAKKAYNKI